MGTMQVLLMDDKLDQAMIMGTANIYHDNLPVGSSRVGLNIEQHIIS